MNKLQKTLGISLLVTAGGAGVATAHDAAAQASLPKQVRDMHCLIGSWRGAGTFQMGADEHPVEMKMDCEAVSGGFAVSCRSSIEGAPFGKAEETDLFGWDPAKNQYHWFAVTSMGETHDHVAEVSKSATTEFVYRGEQEGQPMVEAIKLTFHKSGKRMDLRNDGTVGGKPAWKMTGSVHKR